MTALFEYRNLYKLYFLKCIMKILILTIKLQGGVGVVIYNIHKFLEKKGHEVEVISRNEDLGKLNMPMSILKIRKLVREKNFDIVYTHDWSMALPLLFPFPLYIKKHFCCFHGNQRSIARIPQFFVGKLIGKRLLVVGDSLHKRFPRSKILYNGVDIDFFYPLGKKRDSLGFIQKGTESIFARDLEPLAKKFKLKLLVAENILFEKMNKDFYNKCKVFVSLPPFSAGFNLCWVEAMAAGVPMVIGNNEGVGVKLPITKVKDIKEVGELKKDIDYREWIIKSKLTWKDHVDNLLSIFRA